MGKGRLEAFSDGVIAIILTIMVLSLIPFVTGWMGENHFAAAPTSVYGVVLLMAACAYYILQRQIIKLEGPHSLVATAVGRDLKGKLSPVLYILAIPSTFVSQWIAGALYVAVALMWLVPDKRIERVMASRQNKG